MAFAIGMQPYAQAGMYTESSELRKRPLYGVEQESAAMIGARSVLNGGGSAGPMASVTVRRHGSTNHLGPKTTSLLVRKWKEYNYHDYWSPGEIMFCVQVDDALLHGSATATIGGDVPISLLSLPQLISHLDLSNYLLNEKFIRLAPSKTPTDTTKALTKTRTVPEGTGSDQLKGLVDSNLIEQDTHELHTLANDVAMYGRMITFAGIVASKNDASDGMLRVELFCDGNGVPCYNYWRGYPNSETLTNAGFIFRRKTNGAPVVAVPWCSCERVIPTREEMASGYAYGNCTETDGNGSSWYLPIGTILRYNLVVGIAPKDCLGTNAHHIPVEWPVGVFDGKIDWKRASSVVGASTDVVLLHMTAKQPISRNRM